LSEDTINAVRLVKDAMRCHADGSAVNVVVSPAMLNSAQSAFAKYKQHLEEKKRLEESQKQQQRQEKLRVEDEEQKKREHEQLMESKRKELDQLHKQQAEISLSEKKQHNLLHGAGVLLKEAEAKLSGAIKAGNMDNISVAHGLLEVARERMDTATDELSKLATKQNTCHDKQKRHLSVMTGNGKSAHKKAKVDSQGKSQKQAV